MRAFVAIVVVTLGACASEGNVVSSDNDVIAPETSSSCAEQVDARPANTKCTTSPERARLELINHLAGCRAGLRGAAVFRLGERVLATLRPGESKTVELPLGDVELTIVEDGTTEVRALMLAGAGPVQVGVGCDTRSFPAAGVQPLVLAGPHGKCSDVAASDDVIKVRAGGLELAVARDQYQTIFLPRGTHIVKVAGVERTIELGLGGASVELGGCGTSDRK